MKLLVFTFLAHILWSNIACASSAKTTWEDLVGPESKDRAEFAFMENNPDLPNVLIYGDSISIGYTQRVRENLKAKANVYRLYCNGGESASFIQKMLKMHDAMRDGDLDHPWGFQWDVIHFNVGLHDLKYLHYGKRDKKNGELVASTNTYKENLRSIIGYLERLAPHARLVFATTTPVPEGEKGRIAGDAERYNAAAHSVLVKHPEVIINDLFSFTKPHHAQWWTRPGNVHYNQQGKTAQGDEVTRIIMEALSKDDAVK